MLGTLHLVFRQLLYVNASLIVVYLHGYRSSSTQCLSSPGLPKDHGDVGWAGYAGVVWGVEDLDQEKDIPATKRRQKSTYIGAYLIGIYT